MSTEFTLPADNLEFAWDRPETEASLRERLATTSRTEWLRTAAWLMREARVEQVWHYLISRQRGGRWQRIRH